MYQNTCFPLNPAQDCLLYPYFHSRLCVTSIPIRVPVFASLALRDIEILQQDYFFAIFCNDSGILHMAERSRSTLGIVPRPAVGLPPKCDANDCQVFLPGYVEFSIEEGPNHWDWPFYVNIKIPVKISSAFWWKTLPRCAEVKYPL